MAIECEIWTDDRGSRNARFAVLPRIGEEIIVSLDGTSSRKFLVTKIIHIDLDVHGKDSRPSVQLWVKNAPRA